MRMLLRPFAAVFISLLLLPLYASAAELSTGEKDTIFIGALKVQPSVIELAEKKNRLSELKRTFNSLESQFISALNATRVFQLVERSRKADIELEQGFAAVAVDPNDKNAAQTGKMAGAKFAFLPQIDGFEDRSETVDYQAIGRSSLSRKLFLSAVVQIVDTTTGKLLPDSPSIQLTKTEEVENARIGQASGSDEVIVALAKEMAKKLSQEVVALLRPAKVLTVTGKQVMFNRGSEAGFTKGDLVEIYAVQNVKDEDTGEVFRNEVPVGQAVINRIDKNQSYAAISGDDMGITKGCVVRFMKTATSRAAEGEPPPDATQPEFGTKGDAGSTPGSSEKPLKWK
jgi:curli biogenesis system outer membrane secretion channel CsgG